MYVGKEWVEEGGLMCYGDNLPERYRRAASYVDKILRGAKPVDLQWSNQRYLNSSLT
jgi:putative tryptophan/tyrosine transport system substrate-binding protein